jgi:hypothetical protein
LAHWAKSGGKNHFIRSTATGWYLLIGFGLIEILQWIIIDKNVSKL